MALKFQWDKRKAAKNLKKHEVSFDEAQTVFDDPNTVFTDDERHSVKEQREIAIGHSSKLRLLFVNFTERIRTVRIFSARKATPKERMLYEENAVYDPDNASR